jgi:tetratricopeptide (TPR) repeat protein
LIFAALVLLAVLLAGLLYLRHKNDAAVRPPTPQEITEGIARHGEAAYRQKLYAPLIATYKGLLEKMPDNVDLKKKLAFAYFGAMEYDKALPLLKEVTEAGLADDEVRREMEIIGKSPGNL